MTSVDKNRGLTKIIILFSIISILIISIFFNIKLSKENRKLKSYLPLFPGEKISYFKLIDMNDNVIDREDLRRSKISLLFIINESCSSCSGNLPLFNKISRILSKDGVGIFAIILDKPSTMFNFIEDNEIDFNLYVPEDLNRFKKELRLNAPTDQVILYHNKKVVINFLGKLDGKSYTKILRTSKEILKK